MKGKNEPQPQIGTCDCKICEVKGAGRVSRTKRGGSGSRGKLYYNCDGCGCIQAMGDKAQQVIIDSLMLWEPHEHTDLAARMAPKAPVIEPELEPKREPTKTGWFDDEE